MENSSKCQVNAKTLDTFLDGDCCVRVLFLFFTLHFNLHFHSEQENKLGFVFVFVFLLIFLLVAGLSC